MSHSPNPATAHFMITPSDTDFLPQKVRALYCAADGDVVVVDEGGTSVTYAVTAKDILPIQAVKVLASGTTATVIGWV